MAAAGYGSMRSLQSVSPITTQHHPAAVTSDDESDYADEYASHSSSAQQRDGSPDSAQSYSLDEFESENELHDTAPTVQTTTASAPAVVRTDAPTPDRHQQSSEVQVVDTSQPTASFRSRSAVGVSAKFVQPGRRSSLPSAISGLQSDVAAHAVATSASTPNARASPVQSRPDGPRARAATAQPRPPRQPPAHGMRPPSYPAAARRLTTSKQSRATIVQPAPPEDIVAPARIVTQEAHASALQTQLRAVQDENSSLLHMYDQQLIRRHQLEQEIRKHRARLTHLCALHGDAVEERLRRLGIDVALFNDENYGAEAALCFHQQPPSQPQSSPRASTPRVAVLPVLPLPIPTLSPTHSVATNQLSPVRSVVTDTAKSLALLARSDTTAIQPQLAQVLAESKEDQVKTLQRRVEQYLMMLDRATENVRQATLRLRTLTDAHTELEQRGITQAAADLADIQRQCLKLSQEIEALQTKISLVQQSAVEALDERKQSLRELQSIRSLRRTVRQHRHELRGEHSYFRRQQQKLLLQIRNVQMKSMVLQADVSRKRQELGKWQALIRKVQRATGVSDPQAVGRELLAQEAQYVSLQQVHNENTAKLEQLSDRCADLKSQVGYFRLYGVTTRRHGKIDDKEAQLASLTTQMDDMDARATTAAKQLAVMCSGIVAVLKQTKLLHVTDAPENWAAALPARSSVVQALLTLNTQSPGSQGHVPFAASSMVSVVEAMQSPECAAFLGQGLDESRKRLVEALAALHELLTGVSTSDTARLRNLKLEDQLFRLPLPAGSNVRHKVFDSPTVGGASSDADSDVEQPTSHPEHGKQGAGPATVPVPPDLQASMPTESRDHPVRQLSFRVPSHVLHGTATSASGRVRFRAAKLRTTSTVLATVEASASDMSAGAAVKLMNQLAQISVAIPNVPAAHRKSNSLVEAVPSKSLAHDNSTTVVSTPPSPDDDANIVLDRTMVKMRQAHFAAVHAGGDVCMPTSTN